MIETVLDEEERGRRRGEEEGATRRKERVKKWLEDASLTSGSC